MKKGSMSIKISMAVLVASLVTALCMVLFTGTHEAKPKEAVNNSIKYENIKLTNIGSKNEIKEICKTDTINVNKVMELVKNKSTGVVYVDKGAFVVISLDSSPYDIEYRYTLNNNVTTVEWWSSKMNSVQKNRSKIVYLKNTKEVKVEELKALSNAKGICSILAYRKSKDSGYGLYSSEYGTIKADGYSFGNGLYSVIVNNGKFDAECKLASIEVDGIVRECSEFEDNITVDIDGLTVQGVTDKKVSTGVKYKFNVTYESAFNFEPLEEIEHVDENGNKLY